MTWLNPWGWLWGLVAAPVILLYLLRVRRRREVVASTQFWEAVFRETRPRAWWQRMRHLVSLLLQLAFLALLVLAVADPLTAGQEKEQRLWIILVDCSASMSAPADPASPDGPSRLDAARDRALGFVREMREWDEAMVVSFSGDIDVVCGRTADPGTLRRALYRVSPTDVAGDTERAISFAAGLHDAVRRREIIVLTDRRIPDTHATDADLRWVRIGQAIENVGITAFASRASEERPDLQRLLIRVLNATAGPREVSVALRSDSVPFDSVFFDLAEDEERTEILEHPFPGGGIVEARIIQDGPDAIAADDRAYVVIPPTQPVRVTLVAPAPNLFLAEVLAAQPLVVLSAVTPQAADSLSAETTDIAVFYQHVPRDLPPVNSLYVDPRTNSPLWTLGEPRQHILVSTQDAESPVLRHVDLDLVHIDKAIAMVTTGAVALVTSFEHVLCASWQQPDRRILALSIDLESSDLPLRTAFPILMANAVNWLADRTEETRAAEATGALVPVSVSHAETVTCRGPAGEEQSVEVIGGRATIGPLRHVGLYRVFAPGDKQPLATFAANLANRAETGRPPAASAEPPAEDRLAGMGSGRAVWLNLVLLALILFVAEWGLYQRRVVE